MRNGAHVRPSSESVSVCVPHLAHSGSAKTNKNKVVVVIHFPICCFQRRPPVRFLAARAVLSGRAARGVSK
jgi:hypothetical protein